MPKNELALNDNLLFIRTTYGDMINNAVYVWGGRPEVIAGIIMRETEGGLSPLLDVPGPAGRGDHGHGHGLMQIDDRSFPAFVESGRWSDPAENIKFGAYVLSRKLQFLEKRRAFIPPDMSLERLSIASYNAGEGRVFKAVSAGHDPDSVTAHGDYAKTVLMYAEMYKALGA